jgi:hypothetical protein
MKLDSVEGKIAAGLAALGMVCATVLIATGKLSPADAARIAREILMPVSVLMGLP